MLADLGDEQTLLFINYGQRHLKEHFGAMRCSEELGVPLKNVAITGETIFKSALVDPKLEIPSGEYTPESLAVTVVPNRNSVMANLAAALAVSLNYDGIAMAMHAGDHAVYPDCTPGFVSALEGLLCLATNNIQFKVVAPFVNKSKREIVTLGAELGVPFEYTWSCYQGGALHCGMCSTCQERKNAFEMAHIPDPTEYEV
jgi:7-cyano-7-deazaguanine synthase